MTKRRADGKQLSFDLSSSKSGAFEDRNAHESVVHFIDGSTRRIRESAIDRVLKAGIFAVRQPGNKVR